MVGEDCAHPVHRGEVWPVLAGTEDKELRLFVDDRCCDQLRVRVPLGKAVAEERHELRDLPGKLRSHVCCQTPA
jgi:hypothetical protein